ncbi:MFS transporter [Nonomuraea endophytica]|uniref:MFS transporter n=1 Tax=Nonomuraea endophytica TaxID=714136 RepID=UPI0037C93E36
MLESRQKPHGATAVTLLSVLLGVLAVAMSIAGTAVAVPDIGADLRTSGPPLQWVVAGYNLTFAAFTLVCGSVADLFGRRRMFAIGAAVFGLGSVASGLAGDVLLLDLARLLAGVGGAAIMASGGALLASTFRGTALTRAFAAMGTMAGVGIAIGPSLSGWMVGLLGWRATFGAYALVAVVILVGTPFIGESRGERAGRLDLGGMLTFVGGLAALMFGIMQGPEEGWGEPLIVAALGLGVLLLVAFVVIERRTAAPVLDLSLLGDRRFLAWCLGTLATSAGFLGVLVFLPTYLQGAGHVSAQGAGLTMLMLTGPVLVVPPAAGWLVTRGVSPRLLMTLALLSVAGGNAWLTVLHPAIGPLGLLGPLLLIGIGMGVSFGVTDGQAMRLVEPGRVGMAAGVLNTVRGGAEALVIAVFGAVLLSLVQAGVGAADTAGRVVAGDLSGNEPFFAAQYTGAWQVALWAVALLTAACALAVCAMLAPEKRG